MNLLRYLVVLSLIIMLTCSNLGVQARIAGYEEFVAGMKAHEKWSDYRDENSLKEASVHFRGALRTDPSNARYQRWVARTLFEAGEYRSIVQILSEIAPEDRTEETIDWLQRAEEAQTRRRQELSWMVVCIVLSIIAGSLGGFLRIKVGKEEARTRARCTYQLVVSATWGVILFSVIYYVAVPFAVPNYLSVAPPLCFLALVFGFIGGWLGPDTVNLLLRIRLPAPPGSL